MTKAHDTWELTKTVRPIRHTILRHIALSWHSRVNYVLQAANSLMISRARVRACMQGRRRAVSRRFRAPNIVEKISVSPRKVATGNILHMRCRTSLLQAFGRSAGEGPGRPISGRPLIKRQGPNLRGCQRYSWFLARRHGRISGSSGLGATLINFRTRSPKSRFDCMVSSPQ
jgi:hypothetical protein